MIASKRLFVPGLVLAIAALQCAICVGQKGEGATPATRNQKTTAAADSTAPLAEITADGYKLVWHDEFNKDGPLNSDDWAFEQGFIRNQELQWYQPENAVCKDGFLVIEARKEAKPNPRYVPPGASGGESRPAVSLSNGPALSLSKGARGWQNRPTIEVTSASVTTRGKHSWQYGRFEIRAKIDTRAGSWPAFWMMGTQGRWPACGEVDIMEYFGNTVLANVAWEGKPGGAPAPNGATWNTARMPLKSPAENRQPQRGEQPQGGQSPFPHRASEKGTVPDGSRMLPANWADQFHVWRMDWDEKSIKLFLDDKQVNEQDLSKTINTSRGRGALENPFVGGPMYLILNQAIGGQAGGDPSHTEFPVRFLVDYMRVWQKVDAGSDKR